MKRSSRPSRPTRRQKRTLNLQTLESRQLLAAHFGGTQNVEMPEDVNADGAVSSLDALMVINRIHRGADNAEARPAFHDVNGDGNVTSLDALRVINRMGRDRADGGRPRQPPVAPGDQQPGDVQPGNQQSGTEEAEVRSIDGTGNNIENPLLGSAGTELRRLVDSDYADGISEPSGADRLSAREISNIVADQDESVTSARGLSDLVWQWGQFVDHDITLTDVATDDSAESFNIEVPTGDPLFDPDSTGTVEIALTRSEVAVGTGIDSPAEQVNGITAFIDGSMVYGSSEEVAASLRSFQGGRMLTSDNDLLPIGDDGFFMAGDVRANEQSGLTSLHTLFVREHNRIADEIGAENPSLTDEQVYQQARELVIAEIQAITYNEYLPALLGRDAIPPYEGYDSTVDPTISNLFATAAYRYGHTSLSSDLLRLDDDGNVIDEGNLELRNAFFNPSEILATGIDPLLKGLASNVSQEIDTQIVDDVRNFLFGPPGAGGFDLAALNIQRGRDHGLPDYNSAREQLGLAPAETFADITSNPELQAQLEAAYGTVDNIDVWVGSLAEDHVDGGSVGELDRTVLIEQFTAIRDGDRFWYQNTLQGAELREIQRTRLSDIIERNTDLTSIQDNAFFVSDAQTDPPLVPRPGGQHQVPHRNPHRNQQRGPQPGRPGPAGNSGDGNGVNTPFSLGSAVANATISPQGNGADTPATPHQHPDGLNVGDPPSTGGLNMMAVDQVLAEIGQTS